MPIDKSASTLFNDQTAALRYANARPFFHKDVVACVARLVGTAKIALAVDVGCGTGQSTLPLLDIAARVLGIDASLKMLRHVPRIPNLMFIQAEAEALPLPNSCTDLITVGLAFHWFRKPQFLSESHRILRRNGWLVIYSSIFDGRSQCEIYTKWHKEVYQVRFPLPPRDPYQVDPRIAQEHGLIEIGTEHYTSSVSFTIDLFTEYLISRTNVLAAIQRGEITHDQAFSQIYHDLEVVFDRKPLLFEFYGDIQYLQNTE
jgi:SAM-dependent methyltransferase